MTDAGSSARRWWDWRLFGLWVLVNAVAFAVIPLVGAALEQLASSATKNLVHDHRAIAVLIIAVIGAALQGTLVGRWQWRILRRRVPDLQRRRWVVATLVPVFIVWLLVIGPQAADVLAKGGSTLIIFRNGFIQALVLGPLIGLLQATALRPLTSRWAWWFVADVTTYLSGTLLRQLGVWLQHELSLPAHTPCACREARPQL
jgi:magnesium-transporting ATPase (P-type)